MPTFLLRRIFDKENNGIWKEFNLKKVKAFVGGGGVITKDNMFLRDVLAGCCKINTSESTHVIAMEIIWNNSQITCYNKILFYHDWYKKGIKLIENII